MKNIEIEMRSLLGGSLIAVMLLSSCFAGQSKGQELHEVVCCILDRYNAEVRAKNNDKWQYVVDADRVNRICTGIKDLSSTNDIDSVQRVLGEADAVFAYGRKEAAYPIPQTSLAYYFFKVKKNLVNMNDVYVMCFFTPQKKLKRILYNYGDKKYCEVLFEKAENMNNEGH